MIEFGIAQIGIGYWGSKLKKYIIEHQGLNLKCLCDSKTNLDEIWYNKDIQAVIIATPNETHERIIANALISNKHVFCEKPLTLSHESSEWIRKTAKKRKRIVITDYIHTFSRGLQEAQRRVNSGRFGDLTAIEIDLYQMGKFNSIDVYTHLGSHALSILDMFIPLENDKLSLNRFDLVTRNNTTETGLIHFSDGANVEGKIGVSLNHLKKRREITLYCENGVVVYDINYGVMSIEYEEEREQMEIRYFNEGENLRYSIAYLYDCLIGSVEDNLDRSVAINERLKEIGVFNG